MLEHDNPCVACYFDWKDYCDNEKRNECLKLYNQTKEQESEGSVKG